MRLRVLTVSVLAAGMLLGCAEEATYQTPPLPPPPPPPPMVQPEATPEPYTQQAPAASSQAATSAQPPPPPSAPPPPPPSDDGASASQAPPPPVAPAQPAAPSSDQLVYDYPSGSWVYIVDRGWVWIPAGAATVETDGTPYVYLYTPAYGWTWYLSPWGRGPYHYGVWIHHPWHPYGWHGYWVAHPRVVVRLGHPRYYHSYHRR